MANTTNYNWETPDDTDLVKDGAAAIRTLGSSIDTTTKNLNPQTTTGALAYRSATANVNTALPIGTANQVLRVNSGGTAPEWATTADQTPLTTKGDLFGFDTADARIPVGTNGHILTADSSEALGVKWAAPAGGGKILQVVQATYGTETSSTSTTWADTNLTANITPSSASSKVLVLVTMPYQCTRSTNEANGGFRILRGSTFIYGDESASAPGSIKQQATGATAMNFSNFLNYHYVDSPATTSATTYKVQFAVQNAANSGTINAQANNGDSTIILLEIGA